MKRVIAICLAIAVFVALSVSLAAAAEGAKPTYIGSAKCKMCHISQHKTWAASKHAAAVSVLKPEELKKADCMGCHTVGFDAATGAAAEEAVGCESCHGPGSIYGVKENMSKEKVKADPEAAKKFWMANGMVKPGEATCKGCHNEKSPTFKGFDFAKASTAIKHWKDKAAEAAPAGTK
jgi:hypothetical protein